MAGTPGCPEKNGLGPLFGLTDIPCLPRQIGLEANKPATFDLECQGNILFPVINYVGAHFKTKAGMFLNRYIWITYLRKLKLLLFTQITLKQDNNDISCLLLFEHP